MSATKGSRRKLRTSVKTEGGPDDEHKPPASLNSPKGTAKKHDDNAIVQVKLLALQGHTPTQISRQLGINLSSVCRFMGLVKDPRRSPARVKRDDAKHAEWAARAQALFAAASPTPAPAPVAPVASGSGVKRAKSRGKKRATVDDDDDDDADATPAPESESPATAARTASSGQVKKLRFAPDGELERVQAVPKPTPRRLPQVVVRVPLVKARVIFPPKKKPEQPEAGLSSANTPPAPMVVAPAAPAPSLQGPFASSGSVPNSYSTAFGSAPRTALPSAYSTSFGSQSTATASPSTVVDPSTPTLAHTPASATQPLSNGCATSPPLTTLSTLISSLATAFPTTLAPHLPSNVDDLVALGRLQPALAAALVDDLVEWAEQGPHKGLAAVVRRTEEVF